MAPIINKYLQEWQTNILPSSLTSAVQDDIDIIRMEWLENSREKNWFNTDFILKC